MSVAAVWVMIGIAVWHFAVFVPDEFWGGIVGAFLAALAGARYPASSLDQRRAGRAFEHVDRERSDD